MNRLVSIIMPVRNTEKYLEKCLNSILEQTYSAWELVAIDDDSTDTSLNILLAYAQKDSRIKVLKNKGKGIIHALRLAYTNASGNWITRMDSDDKMSPRKLESMLLALEQNPSHKIAVGLVEYFSEETLGKGYERYGEWLNTLNRNGNHYSEIYRECVIPSPCWMMHKNDFETCDALRPDTYPEDYDLCFRMYKNGMRVIPVLEILHFWRDYPQRTSRNDPNYADNRFSDLKMNYFLELDYDKNKKLILWGAGKKGKHYAQKLKQKNIDFHWICENQNKIGHDIYGTILENTSIISEVENLQIIIAISSPDDQIKIRETLEKTKHQYWFFC
ncbi:MAG: glycosyltransferase family 2 protein [Saprospiraceae bacterium]